MFRIEVICTPGPLGGYQIFWGAACNFGGARGGYFLIFLGVGLFPDFHTPKMYSTIQRGPLQVLQAYIY